MSAPASALSARNTPQDLVPACAAMTIPALHAQYGAAPDALAAAREVMAGCFARLGAVDDPGILLAILPRVMIEAKLAALPPFDPVLHPLWGIPFAIKDNIDLAGCPTTAACPDSAYEPAASAFVVTRLEAAGAIPVGKTNLDQFATGLVGVRTPYPVPRNSFDPARVPGGSSSGSAVAVAQGIVSFALGTDTAGSGRIPAGFNNLVGLKPSLGALSTGGVVPACRSLDCISIFALTVDDALTVFLSGVAEDEADPYSRPFPSRLSQPRRIGVPMARDLLFDGEPEMAQAWSRATDLLRALGLTLVEIDMAPFFAVARLLYDGPWIAERRAAVGAFMDEQPEALHPVTRAILAKADGITAVETFRAFYRLAELKKQCDRALADIDALAVPTAPCFPTLADLEADPLGPNTRLGTYTNFVNLLDLAAIAVPGPFRSDGLPAGLTLIGGRGSDAGLAALGRRIFPGTGGALTPASAGKEMQ